MSYSKRRHTRGTYQSSQSCYDLLCLELKKRPELCRNCTSYHELPVKKKPQQQMGRRFQCEVPHSSVLGPVVELDGECRVAKKKKKSDIENKENASAANTAKVPTRNRRVRPEKVVSCLGNKVQKMERKLVDTHSRHKSTLATYSNMLHSSVEENRRLKESVEEHEMLQERICELSAEKEIMQTAIDELEEQIKAAEHKIRQSSTNERRAYSKLQDVNSAHGFIADPFISTSSLLKTLSSNGISDEDMAKAVVSVLCEKKKFRQHVINAVMDSAVGKDIKEDIEAKMYRSIQEKFAPWKCLLQLDLSATVSYRGLDVIRKIEFYGEETKYRRGIFHERTKLSRIARQMEAYGATLLPYEINKSMVKFDIHTATKFLLKKYKLWDHIENGEQVLLAATVDGGQLAWKITQISAGIKICDEKSIDPRTGTLLFGESGCENVQSSIHCYPLHVHIAKDNKDFYNRHLTEFFSQLNQLEDAHSGVLQLAYPADMCSQCKTVKQGGAMKLSTYACYCCGVHKDDLAKPNQRLCGDCLRLGLTRCFHHEVLDEEVLMHLKDEHALLMNDWPHLANYPFVASRIKFGSSGIGDGSTDPRHIEYEPRSVQQRIQHSRLIRQELQLRNISCDDLSGPEQRLMLHEALLTEYRFRLIKGILQAKTKEEAMILLEKAVPCILHVENRISECIIRWLFIKALAYVEDDNHATLNYILEVERFMNENIFGEPGAPSAWKFPYEDNQLGEVKFSNWRARRIIEELDGLIELSIPATDPELQQQWKDVVLLYSDVISLLRRRGKFTPALIDSFQSKADSFFSQWLSLVGYDGITNYVHMLGAGHIRYFLRKWGNLYRLQNQGWEQYNARVAAFWHHRTTKGGNKYDRSRILPIARWLLRLMLWRTGEGEHFFQTLQQQAGDTNDESESDDSDDDL